MSAELSLRRPTLSIEAKQRLMELAQENGGTLTPHMVLCEARDPGSPVYGYIDFSDKDDAAESWYLLQAGLLIRSIKVFIVREPDRPREVHIQLVRPEHGAIQSMPMRGFISLPSMRRPEGGYVPLGSVLQDAGQRAEMLQTALGELRALQRKYAVLEELAGVWSIVEEIG